MSDDLRAALHDLADATDLPALSPSAVRAEAAGRRRRRRLVGGATTVAVLLVAPLAWSAVPERGDDTVVEDVAGDPEAAAPTGRLVSGTFELTYDGRRYDDSSDAALTSCDGLPGLLSTGFQLDSLPPIRSFWFAGTASQQDEAARCLQAMPAAIVAFEADAAYVPAVLSEATVDSDSGVRAVTGRLRPSVDGWLEHDLTLVNDGSAPVVVDAFGLNQVLDGRIAVTSGRCGLLHANQGFTCSFADTSRRLAPGEQLTTTVELDPDGWGLEELRPGTYTLSWPLEVDDPGGGSVGLATIELAYEVLSAERAVVSPPAPPTARPTAPPAAPPAGQTQPVEVFFSENGGDNPLCEDVVAVRREVPVTQAVATAALNELFRGPTPEEQSRHGAGSLFSAATADLLRSVRVEDGIAYVDLRDFGTHPARVTLGNASTSCGGTAFLASVTRTLTQFPTVQDVRLAFEGDPRAFLEFMQMGCEEPVRPGDPCDPAPFRR